MNGSHDAVNICVCCLFVLPLEHLVHLDGDLSALRDALAALVKVRVAPLANIVPLLPPCPWDHGFWHELGHKVLLAGKDAAGSAAGVGSATLLVGLYDWLNLPLESDQRPSQILDLIARVVDFTT
jgi:hypothetical protein